MLGPLSAKGQVFLSPDRIHSICQLIVQVLTLQSVPILLLSQLLGKMLTCFTIIPWARRHSWPLQWFLLPFQRAGCSNSTHSVAVPPQIRLFLNWWTSSSLLQGCYFLEPDRLMLISDDSLHGWDAHLLTQVTQGKWSPAGCRLSMNLLEFRAIRLALLHFCHTLVGGHVLILIGNILAKAQVNREGGTRSWPLMLEWRSCSDGQSSTSSQ